MFANGRLTFFGHFGFLNLIFEINATDLYERAISLAEVKSFDHRYLLILSLTCFALSPPWLKLILVKEQNIDNKFYNLKL